jgi:hypothetical protein
MGLLYEMVIKKRNSALLLQQQISWKKRLETHARQVLSGEIQQSEQGRSSITQHSVQANAIFL